MNLAFEMNCLVMIAKGQKSLWRHVTPLHGNVGGSDL